MLAVSICTGGACTSAGAASIVEACTILASPDETVILEKACCSLCPRGGKVVIFEDDSSSVVAAADPVAVAIELLGGSIDPKLAAACAALSDARASPSVASFSAVLDAGGSIEALLQSSSQAALEPEPLVWEDSTWLVNGDSELALCDSAANFEFGTCGDMVLMDCTADEEGELGGPTLSGIYEGEGAGEFSLSMSEDGRRFRGTLSDDDGSELEWSGLRNEGSREEQPPGVHKDSNPLDSCRLASCHQRRSLLRLAGSSPASHRARRLAT